MTQQNWNELSEVLSKFILGKVNDHSLSEDLLQETLIKIHLNIHRLRHEEKLLQWAFQIARNVVNDYFKENQKAAPDQADDLPVNETIQEDAMTRDLALWIPEAIKLLPEKYRQAIYLTEIEGVSQKELAERLELSYSGAKSRVQRGREKLKDIILQCCEVITDNYGNVIDYHSRVVNEEDCCD